MIKIIKYKKSTIQKRMLDLIDKIEKLHIDCQNKHYYGSKCYTRMKNDQEHILSLEVKLESYLHILDFIELDVLDTYLHKNLPSNIYEYRIRKGKNAIPKDIVRWYREGQLILN